MKVGSQWSFGVDGNSQIRTGDLVQNYNDVAGKSCTEATLDGCAPNTVTVYNTPARYFEYVNYDLGIYAQDTWTMKRLTRQPGRPLRHVQREEPGRVPRGRPLRAGLLPRRGAGPAELDRHLASLLGRVRPVRQRQDRPQGQRQQVHAAVGRRLGEALRPVHDRDRLTELARSEWRRHRAGQRDRRRAATPTSACRPGGRRTPNLRREYNVETDDRRAASAAAARLGVRRLLPSPLLQPGGTAESVADGGRLDARSRSPTRSATAR